jgi:hypothetical protein
MSPQQLADALQYLPHLHELVLIVMVGLYLCVNCARCILLFLTFVCDHTCCCMGVNWKLKDQAFGRCMM